MKILGLTGPSGAGKGFVSAFLTQKGASVIDCDALYHDLLARDADLQAALCAAFPVCVENGQMQRRKLAAEVFANPDRLRTLESIAYAYITRAIRARIAEEQENHTALLVLDAPTLFESGADALCDATAAVLAPPEVRLARILTRDGISEEAAKARMANQHTEDWFREHCTYAIVNDADPEKAEQGCEALWAALMKP